MKDLRVAYLTRHYRDCPYKSVGQVLAMLYVLDGYTTMENCTVGENEVQLFGSKYASIEWDDELQIPIFEFEPDNHLATENQKRFLAEFEEITAPYVIK